MILKTKIEYQQKLLTAKLKGEDFTSDTITKDSAPKIRPLTVEKFYLALITNLRNSGNIGNSFAYLNSYNSLKKFNKGKQLIFTFDKIDIRFLDIQQKVGRLVNMFPN